MNKRFLKKMLGFVVQLEPKVIHRDDNGRTLPHKRGDHWRVTAVEPRMMLEHMSAFYGCPLFYDRIIKCEDADLHYGPTFNQCTFILNKQIVVIGDGRVIEEPIR